MAAEIRELWLEYEEGNTLEADIAMQLDKFEMIVQANEYEIMHPGKKLEGFFQSTAGFFTHPEVGIVTCDWRLFCACAAHTVNDWFKLTYCHAHSGCRMGCSTSW